MTKGKSIEAFIKKYEGASRTELKSRLFSLNKRSKTSEVRAEIKAIVTLLA